MQHTQQDETILRDRAKEDIDDLISAPIPAGWSVSDKTARPRAVFSCHSLYNFHSFGYNMRAILWK